ncbi:ATP-binding protein [Falsiroseomonas ponticola]|uniref:ATP-binding protein n=1 Tax=Falsiroseomonas ponticola TaxID=2786951 RepID=UPI001933C758|nr:ATP-binding protein [Roseomonas ponticola]
MQWHLALFAAVLALPILVFVAALLWRVGNVERARLEQEALAAARGAAVAVDRELAGLSAMLNLLSLSQPLRAGDLPAFHAQVVELQERLGVTAVLRDAAGRRLVNARVPFGSPQLMTTLPAPAATRPRPTMISGLFQGAAAGEALFAIEIQIPPLRPGEGPAFLSLSLPVTRIRDVLASERIPREWTVAVVDDGGTILARNARHEEFVGRPATQDLRDNTRGREGTWRGTTADGRPVLGTYARSALADWRVAVGVPDHTLAEPLRRSLLLLVATGALLALISLLLALAFGRRIAAPLQAVAASARAMGDGAVVPAVPSGIREVAQIGDALATASATLHAREEELKRLNEALEIRVMERTRDLAETNARLIAAATGRDRAEEQLRQAQKMEAVGRLTGGVAHDFNNLLTVVLGNLTLVKRRLDEGVEERVRRGIEGAIEGAQRAASLTARLLAFSRQQPLAPEAVDVNRLVAGMSDLLRRTLGEDVAVETVLAGGLWRAHADPNQLESSLLNLAVNARDAMPGGGKLTIETANAYLDEAYAAGRDEVKPGQYVAICVSDTGAGMPPDVVGRAFEPFFTTKPVGKGTGLGLSQVYGFAKQSGGHAAIYSEPGHGTAVKLYLPRLRDGELPADAPTVVALPEMPRDGAGRLVLLVEDDPMVRDFAVTALEEGGCRVVAAADGPAALAALDAHPGIAILFTDVVLTGPMNGRQLANAVLERRPGLPVLFTTGYTRNAIIHHGRLDEGVQLLGKPYSAAGLVAKVLSLLDGPDGPPPPPSPSDAA